MKTKKFNRGSIKGNTKAKLLKKISGETKSSGRKKKKETESEKSAVIRMEVHVEGSCVRLRIPDASASGGEADLMLSSVCTVVRGDSSDPISPRDISPNAGIPFPSILVSGYESVEHTRPYLPYLAAG